jgi:hypothetical protein
MANPSPEATPGLVMSGMDVGPGPLALKGAALRERTSFGLVSPELVPLAVDQPREPDATPLRNIADQGTGQGMSRARRARPIRDRGNISLCRWRGRASPGNVGANADRSIPSVAMSARPGKESRSYVQQN